MGPASHRVLAWHKAQPRRKFPAILEVRRIAHRRDQGRRGEWPNARNGQEALADWMGLTDGVQLLVVICEALLQRTPLLLELPEHVPTQQRHHDLKRLPPESNAL